jgi:hypothetical protein
MFDGIMFCQNEQLAHSLCHCLLAVAAFRVKQTLIQAEDTTEGDAGVRPAADMASDWMDQRGFKQVQ